MSSQTFDENPCILFRPRIYFYLLLYLFVLFESNTSVCLHNKSRFIVHSLIFLLFFFCFFICNPQISSKRNSSVFQNHFYSFHEEKNIKKTKTLNDMKFISKLLQEILRHCLCAEYLLHKCGRFIFGIFVLQWRIPAAIYWSKIFGKKKFSYHGKIFLDIQVATVKFNYSLLYLAMLVLFTGTEIKLFK